MEVGPAELKTRTRRGASWLARAGFLETQRRDPQSQELTPGEGVPTSRYYHWNKLKLVLELKTKNGTNCCWSDADRTSKKIERSKSLLPLLIF